MLKRNTTRVESGIPLRDSLIGFMQGFCTCADLLAERRDQYGNLVGANGQTCGARDPNDPSRWNVDPQEFSFCKQTNSFATALNEKVQDGCSCRDAFREAANADSTDGDCVSARELAAQCQRTLPPGPDTGKCPCRDALAGSPICGNVTRAVIGFCENPLSIPVAVGQEDGRIGRRVK